MRAEQLAAACLDESGAGRMGERAKEVALIAIAQCGAAHERPAWKKAIRSEYRRRNPECGSVFLIFILPVIISLVTQWLSRWIFSTDPSLVMAASADAATALGSPPR